jgi:hypothetical protein
VGDYDIETTNGCYREIIVNSIVAFPRIDWGKTREASVRIVGALAMIRIVNLRIQDLSMYAEFLAQYNFISVVFVG